jgi:hypothetical protein
MPACNHRNHIANRALLLLLLLLTSPMAKSMATKD